MTETSGKAIAAVKQISLKEFFESVPPGTSAQIIDLCGDVDHRGPGYDWRILVTDLNLHCPTSSCDGLRFFSPQQLPEAQFARLQHHFLTFTCRNCRQSKKTFAFTTAVSDNKSSGEAFKYGEQPTFGPPTPAKVITLIGAERDYFLKGRRSENQGLGIAAFAYYRRVVENQKTRIIDEVIRVAEKVGATPEVIADLKKAKSETQFSKAVDAIKHGVPESLLIQGHNPLSLLHSALSQGLHAESDEDCLKLATSIRLVLTELVERMAAAMREEAELSSAVKQLLSASAAKAERKNAS